MYNKTCKHFNYNKCYTNFIEIHLHFVRCYDRYSVYIDRVILLKLIQNRNAIANRSVQSRQFLLELGNFVPLIQQKEIISV